MCSLLAVRPAVGNLWDRQTYLNLKAPFLRKRSHRLFCHQIPSNHLTGQELEKKLWEGFSNCWGRSPLSGPLFWGKAAQCVTRRPSYICTSQAPLGSTKTDKGAGCCWYEQGLPSTHVLVPSIINATQDQRGDKTPQNEWSSFAVLSCSIAVKSRNRDMNFAAALPGLFFSCSLKKFMTFS